MSNSLVSLITPNYNSENFIQGTWMSIKNQSYQIWEWIIVDDKSTDNSPEYLRALSKEDTRVKFLKRTHSPQGASTCRNIGIDSAKGDFLMFLDADDLLSSTCLETRLKLMTDHPQLDFGVFKMQIFHKEIKDSQQIINKLCSNKRDYLLMFLSYNIPWQTSCPLWRSSFILKNKIRFSEDYHRLQDVEFHTKTLLLHNPKYRVFTDIEPDCYYRQPSRKLRTSNIASIKRTIGSVKLYYSEMNHLLTHNRPEALHYLDNFSINIFHSLLFYTKLPAIKPVAQLYRDMNHIRQITLLSYNKVMLFAIFNVLGLTFIKGAGVSRLWKILNS